YQRVCFHPLGPIGLRQSLLPFVLPMGDYQALRVWAEAHELVLDVYRVTRLFPADERFNLTPHIRRTAASVSTNIAEGAGRNTVADFRNFCRISLGSANELHYQLRLACDLGYLYVRAQTACALCSPP